MRKSTRKITKRFLDDSDSSSDSLSDDDSSSAGEDTTYLFDKDGGFSMESDNDDEQQDVQNHCTKQESCMPLTQNTEEASNILLSLGTSYRIGGGPLPVLPMPPRTNPVPMIMNLNAPKPEPLPPTQQHPPNHFANNPYTGSTNRRITRSQQKHDESNKNSSPADEDAALNIHQISRDIIAGRIGVVLTKEELQKYSSLSANSVKYSKRCDKVMKRYFKTISEHLGSELGKAALTVVEDKGGNVQNCFIKLITSKTKVPSIHTIINASIMAVVKEWRMEKGHGYKKTGDVYEPSTFNSFLKTINSEIKAVSQYNLFFDFRDKGGYVAVLQEIWREEMKKDPRFGSGPFAAVFDPEAVEKVRKAIRDGNLSPESNFLHLVMINVWGLGTFWWFRGETELLDRTWDEVSFLLDKVSILMKGETKSNNLKLGASGRKAPGIKPILPNNVVNHPSSDPYCPCRFLNLLHSNRNAKAPHIQRGEKNVILVMPKTASDTYRPMVASDITELTNSFAKICGFDPDKHYTAHGNRKLGISIASEAALSLTDQKNVQEKARHASIVTTQNFYNKPSERSRNTFNENMAKNTSHSISPKDVCSTVPVDGSKLETSIPPRFPTDLDIKPTKSLAPVQNKGEYHSDGADVSVHKLSVLNSTEIVDLRTRVQTIQKSLEESDGKLAERDHELTQMKHLIRQSDNEKYELEDLVRKLRYESTDKDDILQKANEDINHYKRKSDKAQRVLKKKKKECNDLQTQENIRLMIEQRSASNYTPPPHHPAHVPIPMPTFSCILM